MNLIIDGVVLDDETGEIMEGVSGDRMEWLTLQHLKAAQNVAGWEQRRAVLKLALSRLLSEAGVRTVRTPYGTPAIMPGRETVNVSKLRTLLAERELGPVEELRLYRTAATALNVRTVRDFLAGAGLGADVEGVVRVGDDYLRVDPPRDPAPEVGQLRERREQHDA